MQLWILAVWFLALPITTLSQSTAGFISIDCGYNGTENYTEPYLNIVYSPDSLYVDTGVNTNVSQGTNLTGLYGYYKTLRNFPIGRRNCYTLAPVMKGQKYLVRAEFQYGNFDGRNSVPSFDLYLGIHFWDTVSQDDFSRREIIAVFPGESIQVCLVNKGKGTPYISVLELRPLKDSMYTLVNSSQALVLRNDRLDLGLDAGTTRYPGDPYDRIWFASMLQSSYTNVSTNRTIKNETSEFNVPANVLSTAITTQNSSVNLDFTFGSIQGEDTIVFLHFAEVQQLKDNERREFDVYVEDSLLESKYKPIDLTESTIFRRLSGTGGNIAVSLRPTRNSTLPPILNALEILTLRQLSGLSTYENDANAISTIRDFYKMRTIWQGDPCMPKDLVWEGLTCSYNDSQSPRIISLNLSNLGLSGEISPFISNLTALSSLDLSNNNLTGGVPADLAGLSELKVLNLANNKLSGQAPLVLLEKSAEKELSLSTDGNANLCARTDLCVSKRSNVVLIIAIVIPTSLLLLFLVAIIAWMITRRKNQNDQESLRHQDRNIHSESSQFTFADIVHITKNFQQQLGKGGFGVVYRGQLKNGTDVAVKMISRTSSQGDKEFQAEAQILTRVHHRNLVSLIGYCSDRDNLALVYELMAGGSLSDHLADGSMSFLPWSVRLKIAVDIAQGLEYLHKFCKPPIVHRDVKSTNILLNEAFEAKLADFGLSRLFKEDGSSYISTVIAGTPGYLDPEYYRTSMLNEKSDVYSFGIVLLELITGKPPIINGLENISLVSWVKSRIEKGDIATIVDERLQGSSDLSYLWKAIDVAILCTDPVTTQRPSMNDVVLELKESLASIKMQDMPREAEGLELSPTDTLPIFLRSDESPLPR